MYKNILQEVELLYCMLEGDKCLVIHNHNRFIAKIRVIQGYFTFTIVYWQNPNIKNE